MIKITYLEKYREEIFKKYSNEELLKDIKSYITGNGNLNKTLNNFFEELIFQSCGKRTKVSPMETLMSDDLMEKVLLYISEKPKFFTGNEIQNVKSFFRNSASWVRKVANFPSKAARDIYNRYNLDNKKLNCLDTSCGFGSRMSAVLLSGNNYYGFDPNEDLFLKLKEYYKFLFDNGCIKDYQICNLYCCGSEVFREELVNTIDISFTSPPYFNLEKYGEDNAQSTLNYDNYDRWVHNFVIPTVNNTVRYLKIGGYAMINIKNINQSETCYDDFLKAFNSTGCMKFIECFDIKLQSKKNYGMKYNNLKGVIIPKEPVMVFRKINDI